MLPDWIDFLLDRLPELWLRTGEHLMLTGLSTAAAILIGIPTGIFASRAGRLSGPLLGAISILQTIPSLAMLAILLALLQRIGALPAIIALTLYALLPIARNTLTGIEDVPDEVVEAAQGIGMSSKQQLWMVSIPLAVPVIVAGIRTAAVVGVGIATLSAFIGAGGLGQFINRGLALSNTRLILLGAIPAAVLALLVDSVIAATEWGMRPARGSEKDSFKARLKPVALSLPVLLLVVAVAAYSTGSLSTSQGTGEGSEATTIRIGTKNFTEQLVLGELMAQIIEARTDLSVERHFNLGGTMICHGALVSGEIDMYAEYTGTALTAIVESDAVSDPQQVFRIVSDAYRDRFAAEWLEPFGFNNTYAITVRKDDAQRRGWKRISDLGAEASQLRAGFTSEFAERPDGYPGLRSAYGLSFAEVRDLDAALMYDALVKGEVDVICAFATDGRIAAYGLETLEDDRQFFPPYYGAPDVGAATLQAHPELRDLLAELAAELDDQTMRRLNYEVDEKKRSAREVAGEFLEFADLLH
ncbi:MAG: glycine betaine ABC transporter substrate-binding protein [Acidobacteriota bacterium]